MPALEPLNADQFSATKKYLQATAQILGGLQRAYLAKEAHDWQHGLLVGLRGIVTQPYKINGQDSRALIDLVKLKLRLGTSRWRLSEYGPPELLNNVKAWLANQGEATDLDVPNLAGHRYVLDEQQAKAFAVALWWFDERFKSLKQVMKIGLSSPVLLYPHHFDLALGWYPFNDERQLTIGFAPGDQTITEPYVFLSVYPQPEGWLNQAIKRPAYWQKDDFQAAILPYSALVEADQPAELLSSFALPLIKAAKDRLT